MIAAFTRLPRLKQGWPLTLRSSGVSVHLGNDVKVDNLCVPTSAF